MAKEDETTTTTTTEVPQDETTTTTTTVDESEQLNGDPDFGDEADETDELDEDEDEVSPAEAGRHNTVAEPANDPVLGEGEAQDPTDVGRTTAQENVAMENARDEHLNDSNKQL